MHTLDDNDLPWDRLPYESPKAYAAFCMYRDMAISERSLRKVNARRTGSTRVTQGAGVLADWSVRYNWVARVAAFDDYQERQLRRKQQAEIDEMNRRQAQIGTAMQAQGSRALGFAAGARPEDIVKPKTATEAMNMIVQGANLERLARGVANSRTSVEYDEAALDAAIEREIERLRGPEVDEPQRESDPE